jgi:hypothetical protein
MRRQTSCQGEREGLQRHQGSFLRHFSLVCSHCAKIYSFDCLHDFNARSVVLQLLLQTGRLASLPNE